MLGPKWQLSWSEEKLTNSVIAEVAGQTLKSVQQNPQRNQNEFKGMVNLS